MRKEVRSRCVSAMPAIALFAGRVDASKATCISEELNRILGHAAIQFATNDEAARAAQIVISTVPYNVQISIVKELNPALEHKILIRRHRSTAAAEGQ